MDSNGRQCRVLIADDSPDFMHRLVDSLSDLKCISIVACAANGDDVLPMFDAHAPDIAILDIQMPGKCLRDVIRSIRSRSTTMLIVLTIHDSDEFRRAFLALGVDHFLSKRQDAGRLPEIIQRFHAAGFELP